MDWFTVANTDIENSATNQEYKQTGQNEIILHVFLLFSCTKDLNKKCMKETERC
jgi:hypothetical protein